MTSQKVVLKKGPAGDTLISLEGKEVFATSQLSYLLQSPQTLAEDDSAIILDASYWWSDAGMQPEILRIERKRSWIKFVGKNRIEQTHGGSAFALGDCDLTEWIEEVRRLAAVQKNG